VQIENQIEVQLIQFQNTTEQSDGRNIVRNRFYPVDSVELLDYGLISLTSQVKQAVIRVGQLEIENGCRRENHVTERTEANDENAALHLSEKIQPKRPDRKAVIGEVSELSSLHD
jgi:hypothetical protein